MSTTSGSDDDASTGTSGTSAGSFGDWAEPDLDAPIRSLLGPHTLPHPAAIWEELRAATSFDAPAQAAANGWDAYAMVRLVNFLRRAALAATDEGGPAAALRAALEGGALAPGSPLWRDDALLAPVLEDDALIMCVVAEGEEGGEGEERGGGGGGGGGGEAPAALTAAAAPLGAAAEGPLSAEEAAALRLELARARELVQLLGSGTFDGPEGRRRRRCDGGEADPHAGKKGSDNLTYYFDSCA